MKKRQIIKTEHQLEQEDNTLVAVSGRWELLTKNKNKTE